MRGFARGGRPKEKPPRAGFSFGQAVFLMNFAQGPRREAFPRSSQGKWLRPTAIRGKRGPRRPGRSRLQRRRAGRPGDDARIQSWRAGRFCLEAAGVSSSSRAGRRTARSLTPPSPRNGGSRGAQSAASNRVAPKASHPGALRLNGDACPVIPAKGGDPSCAGRPKRWIPGFAG